MKKIVIIGNWKMNKTLKEANEFLDEIYKIWEKEGHKVSKDIVSGIAVPYTILRDVAKRNWENGLIAAQNMHYATNGAFTGEISVAMLKDVGANAVVLGHSERRAMFNETSEDVAKKAQTAIANGITPIIAFGETLEQYESGKTKEVVEKMVKASTAGVDLSKVILAYEPIWAIGTGKTATAADAQRICKFVRSLTQDNVIIQYGGSVKPENVEELMSQPDINGALVGGASLDPTSFMKLLTLNK